ncbi:MAG: pyridoxamine 5'-phosphate oxidase family protein [Candidatus Bathyarchaeia archaeon]|nr:hypothetical protein [Candidatus Bathyarchaeota archaeon A05DMB-4]MDH7595758.1 pyridoxamine 5'-phosphate oxidase family protein [Candidatus Bathyarchaeota archaeon]
MPVWFTYDEGKVYMQTNRKSVKVKNLSRKPCVSLTVYNYRDEAVIIKGKACLIEAKQSSENIRRLV